MNKFLIETNPIILLYFIQKIYIVFKMNFINTNLRYFFVYKKLLQYLKKFNNLINQV